MPEHTDTGNLDIDASVNALPFDHGTRITLSATDWREGSASPGGLAAASARVGGLIEGSALVLTHAAGYEKELRAVGLLDFWADAIAAPDALIIATLKVHLDIDPTVTGPARLSVRGDAEGVLTIVTTTPSLSPRTVVLDRLAGAIRLPHMIDSPLGRGEVVRLTRNASLKLNVSLSDRLSVSIDRPGRGLDLRRSVSLRNAGTVSVEATAMLRIDVRRAEEGDDLVVDIAATRGNAGSISVIADLRATAGVTGLPRDSREVAAALLEDLGEATDSVVDAAEETAPEVFDTLDEMLARARSLQIRAALEASLKRSAKQESLASVTLSLEEGGAATLRSLAAGDLSVLFESPAGVREMKGTLREEVQRRRTIQMLLSLPGTTTRLASRRTATAAMIHQLRLQNDGTIEVGVSGDVKVEHLRTRFERTLRTLFTMVLGGKASNADSPVRVLAIRTLRWTLAIRDDHTRPEELAAYFRRVHALGFTPVDGWFALSELPRSVDGDYGDVTITIDFRFGPERLAATLLGASEEDIRESIRRAYLIATLGRGRNHLIDLAWAYWTEGTHGIWQKSRVRNVEAFIQGAPLRFTPIRESPVDEVDAPASVLLSGEKRRLLERLYLVEQQVVEALASLRDLIRLPEVEPGELLRCVDTIGGALASLDDAAAAPEMFYYVLERLAPEETGGPAAATLTVRTALGDERWSKRLELRRVQTSQSS